MLLQLIYFLTATSLGLAFAYPAYRIVRAGGQYVVPQGTGRKVLSEAATFAAQYTFSLAAIGVLCSKVFGVVTSAWASLGELVIYIVLAATLMAAIDRAIRVWTRHRGTTFRCFVVTVSIGLAAEIVVNRFVISAYFLEDNGLTSRQVKPGARIGSPGGPHVGLAAHLGYYLLRPLRGAVIAIRSEKLSGVPKTWQRAVPERFHFAGITPRGIGRYFGRVVGMPGDTVTLGRGSVTINGQALMEPYLDNQMSRPDGLTVQLGPRDFLIAEDVRKDHGLLGNPFYVVHETQILARQLFIVWPVSSFGFVRAPSYTIPNPGFWHLRISQDWWERLVRM